MKYLKYVMTTFILMIAVMPFMALAQEAAPIPTDEFLSFLFQSFNGLKGASALAIAAFVVQAVIKFLSSDICNQIFKNWQGFTKLIVISGLTIVSGVLSMIVAGVSPMAAIFHSATLTAVMVFANQLIQHFQSKK